MTMLLPPLLLLLLLMMTATADGDNGNRDNDDDNDPAGTAADLLTSTNICSGIHDCPAVLDTYTLPLSFLMRSPISVR